MHTEDRRAHRVHGGRDITPLVPHLGVAFQSDKPPQAYAALGRSVEEYGFGTVSVYGDLLFGPPIAPLIIMAQHTERIQLGPACLNPYTLHPVEIAGQIASLDAVSNGRAYLGIAAGAWLQSVGIDTRDPVGHIDEAISVVRRLLSGTCEAFHGRWFRLEAYHTLQHMPVRPAVPVLIGAWGPKLAALAGRVADEIKVGGTANPGMVPIIRQRLAAGKAPGATFPGIVLGAVTVVDEDGSAARSVARDEVARYLPVVAPLDPTVAVEPELLRRIDVFVQEGRLREAGNLIPDDVLDRFAFAGTPESVVRQVEDNLQSGAVRVEFGTPHGLEAQTGIRLLGERVLPNFR